jgi:molecular chaperone DnaK
LNTVKLLKEPEAAALANGLTQRDQQMVLVFDLGGGTFDVSVLEVGNGFVEVIATSGDGHLGGDDFDAVINWILENLEKLVSKEASMSIKKDKNAFNVVRDAALAAKIKLSTSNSADIFKIIAFSVIKAIEGGCTYGWY